MRLPNQHRIPRIPAVSEKEIRRFVREERAELAGRPITPPLNAGQRLFRDIQMGKFDSIWNEIPRLSWEVEEKMRLERDRATGRGMGGKVPPARTKTHRQAPRMTGGAPR
jgi:hypothetical protein